MSGVIYLEKKISDGLARAVYNSAFSIEYSGAYSRFNEIFNSSKFIVVAGEYNGGGTEALVTTGAGITMDGDAFNIFVTVGNYQISAQATKGKPDIISFNRLN